MNYSDKLKDPRWQKKRLEVLNHFGWKCKICDNKEKTLNVHHEYYEKGKEPWDYRLIDFMVLCQDCHELLHESHRLAKDMLKNQNIESELELIAFKKLSGEKYLENQNEFNTNRLMYANVDLSINLLCFYGNKEFKKEFIKILSNIYLI